MANQSPQRREVLAMLAQVAALGQFPGFSKWAFAGDHHHEEAEPAAKAPYTLQFFTTPEYRTLDVLCELIIPADGTPGARDAGVSEFIDFLVAHDIDLQYRFRSGLAWMDAFAFESDSKSFADISAASQETLLSKLAYKSRQLPSQTEGQQFFALLRKHVVIGYYTSRVGLEQLDYPGLRLYSASPECPHKNDPEHKHLTAK